MHQLIPLVVKQFEFFLVFVTKSVKMIKWFMQHKVTQSFLLCTKYSNCSHLFNHPLYQMRRQSRPQEKHHPLPHGTYLFHANYFICKNVLLVNTMIKQVKRTLKNDLSQPLTFNKHQPKMSLQPFFHGSGKRTVSVFTFAMASSPVLFTAGDTATPG